MSDSVKPVAWKWYRHGILFWGQSGDIIPSDAQPLYAAPPSERWVSNGGDGEYPDLVMVPAEAPCFECGSTERMGTACAPCNPEITDPNFGAGAPLTVEEVARIIRANMPGAPHDLASVNRTAQAILAVRGRRNDQSVSRF